MSFLTPKRVDAEELLDENDVPFDEMARSLRDLRRINLFGGGVRIYKHLFSRLVDGSKRSVRLLDLGTGTSDLPAALGTARKLKTIGLDFKIDHLLYGRDHYHDHVLRVVGDAFKLPFRNQSVDVVTSGHFFHHFSEEENLTILEESLRVSRLGVLVNDTRRHHIPLTVIRLLGFLRLVGPITRLDGAASVRRAYTIGEARRCAARTSAVGKKVFAMFPFRFGMLLRR